MEQPNLSSPLRSHRFQFRLITLLLVSAAACAHVRVAMWNPELMLLMVPTATFPISAILIARRVIRASHSGAAACAALSSITICAMLGLLMGIAMVCSSSAYEVRKYGWRLEVVPAMMFFGGAIGLAYCLPALIVYGLSIWVSQAVRWLVIERRDKYFVEESAPKTNYSG